MNKPKHDRGRPPFDEKLAASYVGKYILVGLTYLDHKGKELRRQQLHGVITSTKPKGLTSPSVVFMMASLGICLLIYDLSAQLSQAHTHCI